MDPWQIVGYLVLGIIQLIGMACVFFITRQGEGEKHQGDARETIASLSEKYRGLRHDVNTLSEQHDSNHTSLADENSKIKDQVSQLDGRFAAFVAECRGQLTAINDKLALRDDRFVGMEAKLESFGSALKDMSISMATLAERMKSYSNPNGANENRPLTDAERRVISLLRQVVRDEA